MESELHTKRLTAGTGSQREHPLPWRGNSHWCAWALQPCIQVLCLLGTQGKSLLHLNCIYDMFVHPGSAHQMHPHPPSCGGGRGTPPLPTATTSPQGRAAWSPEGTRWSWRPSRPPSRSERPGSGPGIWNRNLDLCTTFIRQRDN